MKCFQVGTSVIENHVICTGKSHHTLQSSVNSTSRVSKSHTPSPISEPAARFKTALFSFLLTFYAPPLPNPS